MKVSTVFIYMVPLRTTTGTLSVSFVVMGGYNLLVSFSPHSGKRQSCDNAFRFADTSTGGACVLLYQKEWSSLSIISLAFF
mmetsp:Transcript_23639/g.34845  ORF Transcript_23639/g.34845 Transcript_23639/m.34845 type:complete len:81 (+) Transcript_23639:498-740(+)